MCEPPSDPMIGHPYGRKTRPVRLLILKRSPFFLSPDLWVKVAGSESWVQGAGRSAIGGVQLLESLCLSSYLARPAQIDLAADPEASTLLLLLFISLEPGVE